MKAKPGRSGKTPKKANAQVRHRCEDMLEFWGVSTEGRLFRCAKCGGIHKMDWGKPAYAPVKGWDLRCGDGWLAA